MNAVLFIIGMIAGLFVALCIAVGLALSTTTKPIDKVIRDGITFITVEYCFLNGLYKKTKVYKKHYTRATWVEDPNYEVPDVSIQGKLSIWDENI